MTENAPIALTLDEICHRLAEAKNPLFVLHTRPDGDTAGSAAALVRISRHLGKKAYALSGDPLPGRLEFLLEPEEQISLPLQGEWTVIPVDVASPVQLGRLESQLIGRYAPKMMIDHHEIGERFCDHYLEPGCAATGEIVFRIAERMVDLGLLDRIPEEAVAACFAALSSDTGCFRFSNAGPSAHMAAARMMTLCPQMDTAEINTLLYDSKSLSTIQAESFAGANMEVSEDGRIAWLTVSALDRGDFGLNDEDFETAIDVVRSLRNVEVAFTVKENRDGRFKASIRSRSLNVAKVAQHFGGGGHERAAGCAIAAKTLEEALDLMLEQVESALYK